MPHKRSRPRTRPSHAQPSPSRLPALVISGSSLLLASGMAASLWCWTRAMDHELAADADGVDMDSSLVVAWWTGKAALRWACLSAAGSLAGVLGLLLRSSQLHRVFAITTAVDLLATVLLTLVLSLLTFTPALSQSFSTFLCSSTFASDFSGSPSSLLSAHREREGLAWSDGVELLLWGVETCEDSWRTGMLRVILGCCVACVLRVYGVWVSWEMNGELREQELRDEGQNWCDDREMSEVEAAAGSDRKSASSLEQTLGRSRSGSASSSHRGAKRASTLPLFSPSAGSFSSSKDGKRTRSHTFAHPQLVLVPCVLDDHGRPVYSPSSPSFAFPPHASPPRTRSNMYQYPSPFSPSGASSRSSSRASRPTRTRSSSSTSTSTARPLVESPPLLASFTDEPDLYPSPPLTPTATSCSAMGGGEEKASRRARSRSENDAPAFPSA